MTKNLLSPRKNPLSTSNGKWEFLSPAWVWITSMQIPPFLNCVVSVSIFCSKSIFLANQGSNFCGAHFQVVWLRSVILSWLSEGYIYLKDLVSKPWPYKSYVSRCTCHSSILINWSHDNLEIVWNSNYSGKLQVLCMK